MAKPIAVVTATDLKAGRPRQRTATRQRGDTPSAELVPLQFRMSPEFVQAFKRAALKRVTKLNELLKECFKNS